MSKDRVQRRRFLELIGLSGAIGLAGCTSETADETDTPGGSGGTATPGDETDSMGDGGTSAPGGGHLRVSVRREGESLHPIMMPYRNHMRWFAGLLYSNLTRLDSELNIHGDLATDWEANDALDEWTFQLREDATFHHNGEQVTAQDVKATFDATYSEDVGSPGKGALGSISSVEAPDDTTVRIQLSGANPDYPLYVSSQGWGSIVPKSAIENNFESLHTTDVGSGPFVLDEFETGSRISATAYDDYYMQDENGDPLPKVDRVSQVVVPDTSTEVTSLANKETDIIWQSTPSQAGRIVENDEVNLATSAPGNLVGVAMDATTEPFDDYRVRQAIKLAIDRQAILDAVFNGRGALGQDTLLGPIYRFYKDMPERTRDLEKARSLLADAGYGDGFHLKKDFDTGFFATATPQFRMDAAILVNEHLKEIGVNLALSQVSYDRFASEIWTNAPCYMVWYDVQMSENDFYTKLLHSDGAWHAENNWDRDDVDNHIETARQTTDPEVRQEHYSAIQQLMYERGPYAIPVYFPTMSASNDYVNNYDPHPMTFKFHAEFISLGPNAPTR